MFQFQQEPPSRLYRLRRTRLCQAGTYRTGRTLNTVAKGRSRPLSDTRPVVPIGPVVPHNLNLSLQIASVVLLGLLVLLLLLALLVTSVATYQILLPVRPFPLLHRRVGHRRNFPGIASPVTAATFWTVPPRIQTSLNPGASMIRTFWAFWGPSRGSRDRASL